MGVRGRRWGLAATRQQLRVVEQLMMVGMAAPAIVRAMQQQEQQQHERFACGVGRTALLMRRVREQWGQEDEGARPVAKAAAVRRILRYIQAAQGERRPANEGGGYRVNPNWSAVARFEALLADIQGTRAPIEVNVDVRVGQAAMVVLANMTSEQLAERLAAARERRMLAERARAIDTVGTST